MRARHRRRGAAPALTPVLAVLARTVLFRAVLVRAVLAVAVVAATVLALPVVAPSVVSGAGAAFTAAAVRPPDSFASQALDPVSGLAAARTCAEAAAPAFRSATTAAVQATSVTVTRPAGVVAGDVLLAFVIHHDATSAPTLPAGWTALDRGGTSAGSTLLAARTATAAEPASYTFGGLDASDATAATVLAYRAVDPTTPWEAHGVLTTSASTVTAPSLTALTAPTTWVTGFLVDDYTGGTTVPFPTTQRVSVHAPGVQPVTIAAGDRTLAAAGATGTQVATLASPEQASGFSVLLRAASPDVTLTWTASPDTWSGGVVVARTGTATVTSVTPRSTTTWVDTTLARTSAATYTVRAASGTWRSSAVTVAVPAC